MTSNTICNTTGNNPVTNGQGVTGVTTGLVITKPPVVTPSTQRPEVLPIRASDFSELDRRAITLWRQYARWDEAHELGMLDAAAKLEAGFRRRLKDYERAWREAA